MANHESIFHHLAGAITSPQSPIHAMEDWKISAVLQTITDSRDLRRAEGYPRSDALRRQIDDSICQRFEITPTQLACLDGLHRRYGYPDGAALAAAAVPNGGHGDSPIPGHVHLVTPRSSCYGRTLRFRRLLKATIYERSRAFSAWHVVLQCPGQCKGTYYANKHVMRHGEYKGHFFRALEDGTSPKYITNKSGKCAVAVAFLRDVTVMICRTR